MTPPDSNRSSIAGNNKRQIDRGALKNLPLATVAGGVHCATCGENCAEKKCECGDPQVQII
jgi:hypothetical protein